MKLLRQNNGEIEEIDVATGLDLDKIYVYRDEAFTTVSAAWGTIPMTCVRYDTGNLWDAANNRIVPIREGYYICSCRLRTNATGNISAAIALNGGLHAIVGADGGSLYASGGTGVVYCNGSTDYITARFYTSSARAVTLGVLDTYLSVVGPF